MFRATTLYLFFPVLFDWVGVSWPQLSKMLKLLHWDSSVPFPPVSLQRQVVIAACVHLRGEPVSSYFSMAGCSRHGVSVHCMCVQILSFYATRWPVLPSCMQLTLVSWYVASMLCCHCWMFSLSDALLMQSYPSKVWVLYQCSHAYLCAAQLICFYWSTWNRWYIMANTLKMLTS